MECSIFYNKAVLTEKSPVSTIKSSQPTAVFFYQFQSFEEGKRNDSKMNVMIFVAFKR